jgi:nucleotide-binding universal stress UspA family protein
MDALSRDVDLIVTGSRGWGPIRRVALGSLSDRLIHHASCPVLVVPRTAISAGAEAAPGELTTAAE